MWLGGIPVFNPFLELRGSRADLHGHKVGSGYCQLGTEFSIFAKNSGCFNGVREEVVDNLHIHGWAKTTGRFTAIRLAKRILKRCGGIGY